MSGSRRRWANNPYKLFILLREYDAAASAPRSDLCNCKIEFIFFLFPYFSLQKYFIYEIFDAERFIAVAFFRSLSLSPSLTIFVHKSPIIFEENIFKMHFFPLSSTPFRSACILCAAQYYTVQSCIEGESATHKYKLFCLDIPWIIYVAALLRRSMWTLHKTQCTKCNILDMLSWGGYREKDKPKL